MKKKRRLKKWVRCVLTLLVITLIAVAFGTAMIKTAENFDKNYEISER